jgi:hypothetical protein
MTHNIDERVDVKENMIVALDKRVLNILSGYIKNCAEKKDIKL